MRVYKKITLIAGMVTFATFLGCIILHYGFTENREISFWLNIILAYNDGDLIACFDENIPDSVIRTIAKRQPLRAVFRDSSFDGSPSKINVGEIFKLLAPDTRIKVI